MEKPEVTLKDLYQEIEEVSFSVKMRGYAPEEVDEFMDDLVERLKAAEEKLQELDRYEQWLREEVHQQVMVRAQEEARQLLQGAQDRSRAMLESAQADVAREQSKLTVGIQQYQTEMVEKKRKLEQELQSLQMTVTTYRRQAAQALETALGVLREDSVAPAGHHGASTFPEGEYGKYAAPTEMPIPPQSTPAPAMPTSAPLGTALHSNEDIDRMLEELKKQIR